MNEKINLQDLTALLAEKTDMAKKDAETFLREYFEVMNEALIKDKLLKIKDLGTFKLSLMEDRESVNVTSGERVLIPAHYKVTFSPDKNLAQAVNEPFAFFEAVEINDNAILDEPEESEEIEKETTEVLKESALEEPEKIADAIIEEKTDEIPENEPVEEKMDKNKEKEDFEEPPAKKNKKSIWISIVVFLFLIVLAAGIYYCFPKEKNHQEQVVDTLNPVPEIDQQLQSAKTDSLVVIETPEITNSEVTAVTEPVSPAKATEKKPINTDSKNTLARKRTLSSGDRLTLIALKEYGNKVFWIYLYEENKEIIQNPDIILPGVSITIPPAQKYRIDKNNPESIKRAKDLIEHYKK
jgi:nucleoid DNA-binding protein